MFNTQRIAQLLHRVPNPPEEALPTGVAMGAIDDFEERTGIFLPNDLRCWLALSNGPCVGPGGFYGIHTSRSHLDIDEHFMLFPEWKKRKWLPIAGDGCGNHYVMLTQHECGIGFPVVFVDVGELDDAPTFIVSSDLEHFIVAILEKELRRSGWPFDPDYTTKYDPEILKYKKIPLPWTAR